jgi:hypothetical protein
MAFRESLGRSLAWAHTGTLAFWPAADSVCPLQCRTALAESCGATIGASRAGDPPSGQELARDMGGGEADGCWRPRGAAPLGGMAGSTSLSPSPGGEGAQIVPYLRAMHPLIPVQNSTMTGTLLRTRRGEAADRMSSGAKHIARRLVIRYHSGAAGLLTQRRQPIQMANIMWRVALVLCLIGGFTVSAAAQPAGDKADHITVTPDAVKWVDAPPSIPAGAKWAVLGGTHPRQTWPRRPLHRCGMKPTVLGPPGYDP